MSAIIVNLCGQPGAGKSTGAAYIFSKLKMLGVNAELITEFAKDKCWEESKAVFENQVYIFGKQYFRISRAANKVDVIVTDSPLAISCIYNCYEGELKRKLDELVLEVYKQFNNYTYFLNRVKKYNPVGRFQTESESDKIALKIKNFLIDNQLSFTESYGNIESYDKIVNDILAKLKYKNLIDVGTAGAECV